jgi:hypothetical protein
MPKAGTPEPRSFVIICTAFSVASSASAFLIRSSSDDVGDTGTGGVPPARNRSASCERTGKLAGKRHGTPVDVAPPLLQVAVSQAV